MFWLWRVFITSSSCSDGDVGGWATLHRQAGFLTAGDSLLRSTGSQPSGFRSGSTQGLLLCDTWDLPGLGTEPRSPALQG